MLHNLLLGHGFLARFLGQCILLCQTPNVSQIKWASHTQFSITNNKKKWSIVNGIKIINKKYVFAKKCRIVGCPMPDEIELNMYVYFFATITTVIYWKFVLFHNGFF